MEKFFQNILKKGDFLETKTRFSELKKLKKSNETVNSLLELLSISKVENDSLLALEIITITAESYRYLRMHDEAISFLETQINDDFFKEKETKLKIIDDLVRTLLRTEDFIKLKSVLFNRSRFITNEHQKVMQKFYYAVCHEGLKENKQAIDYLLSIKDNISSSNLVSKYLKLSMLFLKEKSLEKANQYYEIALKFNPKQDNPIFYLAKSDILSYQMDYQSALDKYQEYFIKTKNKRRYLDRYILINIQLNKLDEAWRFYQEYLPVMKNLVSKNYRLIFYESARVLAKKLNNTQEVEKLDYLIDGIKPHKPMYNQFDNVYQLLSMTLKQNFFTKEREVILDMFKAIDLLYKYQKLLYVKKTDNSILFYHYSKGLLLEKNPKITDYTGTLLEKIINRPIVNDLLIYEDLTSYQKGMYKNVETQYVFINGIKRENSEDYFIVYSKENTNFDFQQKLVLFANQILKKNILDFDHSKNLKTSFDNYSKLFNVGSFGLVKIEKGIIQILNDFAKKILDTKRDYIAFEDVQNRLKKKIFLDDLLYKDEMELEFKNKSILLHIIKDDLVIYLLIEEKGEVIDSASRNNFLLLPNENQLLKDYQKTTPKSLILLDIRNYQRFFKDYNYEAYKALVNDLITHLRITSRTHFDNVYLESFNLIYLVIKSIDKRVVKRIVDNLLKLDSEFDLRISVTQVNHSLDFNKLIKLRYLNSLTTLENRFINDNKNFRYNLELAKTLLININTLLDKKFVPLSYQGVGNWKKKSISMIRAIISDKAMLGEKSSLLRVLRSAGLLIDWDLLVVSSLVKDQNNGNYKGKIEIDLSINTLEDSKALKKIIKKLESSSNLLVNYVIRVTLDDDFTPEKLLLGFNLLKAKNIGISLNHFISYINIKTFKIFEFTDYLEIDILDLEEKNFKSFIDILKSYKIDYILNHGTKSLTKTVLDDFSIKYVDGSMYPKYESVNRLI